jgi:hypothetical protein
MKNGHATAVDAQDQGALACDLVDNAHHGQGVLQRSIATTVMADSVESHSYQLFVEVHFTTTTQKGRSTANAKPPKSVR